MYVFGLTILEIKGKAPLVYMNHITVHFIKAEGLELQYQLVQLSRIDLKGKLVDCLF